MAYKITSRESVRVVIAKNLRQIMYDKNMTQRELAEKLGVSGPTVSDWCSGKKQPRPENIEQICSVLGVSASDLYDEDTTRYYRKVEDPTVEFSFTMEDLMMAQQIARLDSYRRALVESILKTSPEKEKGC